MYKGNCIENDHGDNFHTSYKYDQYFKIIFTRAVNMISTLR